MYSMNSAVAEDLEPGESLPKRPLDVLHEDGIGVDGRKRGQAALAHTGWINTNILSLSYKMQLWVAC
jgi:hypothetical protein